MSQINQKSLKVKPIPIILRKDNLLYNNWKVSTSPPQLIRESSIYESNNGDFFKGEFRSVSIVNKYNIRTNTSLTIAKCEALDGSMIEKTSENIATLIGQANYDILFSSLCSVISLELKIRSLLSILTVPKKLSENSSQTFKSYTCLNTDESSTQTEDSMDIFNKKPQKKRQKRQHQSPYVVQDVEPVKPKLKRLIISPKEFQEKYRKDDTLVEDSRSADLTQSQGRLKSPLTQNRLRSLPELKGSLCLDETSSDSIGNISISSKHIPDLDWDREIDKYTENGMDHTEKNIAPRIPFRMFDGAVVYIQGEPESWFHIATKDHLKGLTLEDRQKLMCHQALIDRKLCLTRSTDGNLPIHDAVLNNDTELLRRLCLVLTRILKQSVDIPNDGDITALQMSLRQDSPECLSILLAFGADPLEVDGEQRSPLHIVAEGPSGHVKAILNHCRRNARVILSSDEQLWKDRFENSSDEALGTHLLHLMNTAYNDQGYTPLMLASSLGKYENVKLLLESDPTCVNIKAPNCGDTALYQVVRAACLDATDRGNKSSVAERFKNTIRVLLEFGADPNIQNLAGFSSNDLVSDSNNKDLSMVVANCMSVTNASKLPPGCNLDNYMIIADTPTKGGKKKTVPKKVLPKKIVKKKYVNELNVSDSDNKIEICVTKIDPKGKIQSGKPQPVNTSVKPKTHNISSNPNNANSTATSQPRTGFIDKFQSFIKAPSEPNVIIIKDELVGSPLKLPHNLVQVEKVRVKRKIISESPTTKKKKED